MPHPPSIRQRPVSANPSNGVFLQSRPLSGTLTKDYSGIFFYYKLLSKREVFFKDTKLHFFEHIV